MALSGKILLRKFLMLRGSDIQPLKWVTLPETTPTMVGTLLMPQYCATLDWWEACTVAMPTPKDTRSYTNKEQGSLKMQNLSAVFV